MNIFSILSIVLAGALASCSLQAAGLPGEVDLSFGSKGNGTTVRSFAPDSGAVRASLATPDGAIYLAGEVISATATKAALTRFHADGIADNAWGPAVFDVPGYGLARIHDLVQQPDGKLVVVGEVNLPGPRWLVCRVNTDASLDPGFGDVQTPGCTTPLQGSASAVGLQADGRIVVAGQDGLGDPYRAALTRLSKSGVIDNIFANGKTIAILPADYTLSSGLRELIVLKDGSVLVAGTYGSAGDDQFLVAKFSPSGIPSVDFSQDGARLVAYQMLPPGSRLNIATTLKVLADGSMLVAGTVYAPVSGGSLPRIGLVKLRPDGELSSDFTSPDFPDGQLLIDPCLLEDCQITASDMEVLDNGTILLAGYAEDAASDIASAHVTQLSANGMLDPELNGNNATAFAPGVALVPWDGFSVSNLVLQGERIVLTGDVPNAMKKRDFGAIRLLGVGVFSDNFDAAN